MYYPDLTPYSYSPVWLRWRTILNVGWLDSEHSFRMGKSSLEFQNHLLAACCTYTTKHMRGFHISSFGTQDQNGYFVNWKGNDVLLGHAEIWIRGSAATTFAAPTLVYHYVKDVGYLPPDDFIEAVIRWGRKRGKQGS